MIVAVVGSRCLTDIPLEQYLPPDTTEMVSGGALGVDTCAEIYALKHQIKITIFRPDYRRYHRGAPLRRNEKIVAYSDMVIAFWDGRSMGTLHVIECCRKAGKPIQVIPFLAENIEWMYNKDQSFRPGGLLRKPPSNACTAPPLLPFR